MGLHHFLYPIPRTIPRTCRRPATEKLHLVTADRRGSEVRHKTRVCNLTKLNFRGCLSESLSYYKGLKESGKQVKTSALRTEGLWILDEFNERKNDLISMVNRFWVILGMMSTNWSPSTANRWMATPTRCPAVLSRSWGILTKSSGKLESGMKNEKKIAPKDLY